jgi:hypothetical protein
LAVKSQTRGDAQQAMRDHLVDCALARLLALVTPAQFLAELLSGFASLCQLDEVAQARRAGAAAWRWSSNIRSTWRSTRLMPRRTNPAGIAI